MAKLIGIPFREGFIDDGKQKVHLFTDYRWNDSSFSRRWHVDPEQYDTDEFTIRALTLKVTE